MPRIQGKYFCFTLNNYTEEELQLLTTLGNTLPQPLVYIGYGKEVGGEEKTPHLQGYLELSQRKGLRYIKGLPGLARSHVEKRQGTQDQAVTYCQKDGDYVSFGTLTEDNSGQRTDLELIKTAIREGSTELDIAEAHFSKWIVYRRSFERYRELNCPPRMRRGLRVYVIQGIAGVGKSGYVYHRYPEVFSCPDNTLKWFDGYAGQSVVLIDDYRGGGDPAFLLRLLDIYPLRVPVKGGFVAFNPTTIFITSNLSSVRWHEGEVNYEAALTRRIHYEAHLTQPINFDEEMPALLIDNMPLGE